MAERSNENQRMDDLRSDLSQWRDELNGRLDGIFNELHYMNGRVRKLEQWRSYMLGGMGVLVLGMILVVRYVAG